MIEESSSSLRAFALLAKAGIRADHPTAAAVGRALETQGEINALPHLPHAKAEEIGAQLCDYWDRIVGEKIPDRDDFAWADIVQFVVRRSSEFE